MKRHPITNQALARVQASSRFTRDSIEIVRRVLVVGERQADVASSMEKTPQHVSLLLKNFWGHYQKLHAVPPGWRTEYVTLPDTAWPKVRQIERAAKARLLKSTKKGR